MVFGIDLAASASNPTGICLLNDKMALLKEVFFDDELIDHYINNPTKVIAIDAPLSTGERKCDILTKKYGTMPLTLPSIRLLAERAISLIKRFSKFEAKIIEVFPTGTARILGVYNKNRRITLDNLKLKFRIECTGNISKHQFDAFFSALTGKLWELGYCNEIGNKKGKIVLPSPSQTDRFKDILFAFQLFSI